jgi:phosphopantothenoylcysteine decarboxylase/phosphopantothenate--cysteine ligase
VSANVSLPDPAGTTVVRVETTEQLRTAVVSAARDADAVVMAAAPADSRPAAFVASKIKKRDDGGAPVVELVQTPDILAELSADRARSGQVVVGFAAETGDETGDVLDLGRAKARRKGADLMAVNQVGTAAGFGDVPNTVTVLDAAGEVVGHGAGSKDDVADALLDLVAARLAGATTIDR